MPYQRTCRGPTENAIGSSESKYGIGAASVAVGRTGEARRLGARAHYAARTRPARCARFIRDVLQTQSGRKHSRTDGTMVQSAPSNGAKLSRLAGETSPYLRQHQFNPVDWYPWGPEALQRARELDHPILLSIGYSACHWCHVMAHESFENEDTARLMNDLFVNIKVDREERPDVDAIYMEAVQALSGQGGWPLNVFLTPDSEPFFGGTYFPPTPRHGLPSWPQLLSSVAATYRDKPEDVRHNATLLTDYLKRSQLRLSKGDEVSQATLEE